MSDLVSLVLAAIEETERLAKACPCVEFAIAKDPSRRGRYDLEAYAAGSMTEFDSVSPAGGLPEVYARHIAHNDPAAVLRSTSADREILAMYDERFSDDYIWQPILRATAKRYGISVEEETT